MANSNKLVSIVIPVYNASKFLPSTLNSVLNQNYENLEIILVNDGSTDESLHIMEEFSKNDKRIKIINQRNLGVSAARNKGFYNSMGEYISFIDSDDLIESDMISNLVGLLDNSDYDVANCNVEVFEKDGSRRVTVTADSINSYNSSELLKKFLLGEISHGCWDKLYRRHVLEETSFLVGTTSEDRYFCWEIFKKIKGMVVSPKIGYHYIRRASNSISSNPLSMKNISRIEEALKVKNDVILHYPELYSEWQYYYYQALANLYGKFILQGVNEADPLYKYYIFIKKELDDIEKTGNVYIKKKL